MLQAFSHGSSSVSEEDISDETKYLFSSLSETIESSDELRSKRRDQDPRVFQLKTCSLFGQLRLGGGADLGNRALMVEKDSSSIL